MKTRTDLYSNEAAELLRVISCYKSLKTGQILRLFPGREEKIRTLIGNLRQQKRLWLSSDGRMLKAAEDIEFDTGTVKAFWVLLDFLDRVEYHCAGSFPVSLTFFLDAELYEVVYIPPEQEALICHALYEKPEVTGKRILIVEEAGQIERVNISGASGYCTVNESGEVQYFQRKRETT